MRLITPEQIEVMMHTKHAPNFVYCGKRDDSNLKSLIERGYMRGPIEVGFLSPGEAYFKLTTEGWNFLRSLKEN